MLASLRIVDFSDRELLHILNDLANEEGWTETHEIAQELGIDHKHPALCVAQRLSWLKRHGCVEKHPDEKSLWRLTDFGDSIMRGKLRAAAQRQLEEMDEGQLLLATRMLAGRYQGMARSSNGGGNGAWLLRREWTHGTYLG